MLNDIECKMWKMQISVLLIYLRKIHCLFLRNFQGKYFLRNSCSWLSPLHPLNYAQFIFLVSSQKVYIQVSNKILLDLHLTFMIFNTCGATVIEQARWLFFILNYVLELEHKTLRARLQISHLILSDFQRINFYPPSNPLKTVLNSFNTWSKMWRRSLTGPI